MLRIADAIRLKFNDDPCAILNHAITFRAQKQSSLSADDREKLDELDKNMIKRKAQLYEIEQSLPQKNSTYLKVNDG